MMMNAAVATTPGVPIFLDELKRLRQAHDDLLHLLGTFAAPQDGSVASTLPPLLRDGLLQLPAVDDLRRLLVRLRVLHTSVLGSSTRMASTFATCVQPFEAFFAWKAEHRGAPATTTTTTSPSFMSTNDTRGAMELAYRRVKDLHAQLIYTIQMEGEHMQLLVSALTRYAMQQQRRGDGDDVGQEAIRVVHQLVDLCGSSSYLTQNVEMAMMDLINGQTPKNNINNTSVDAHASTWMNRAGAAPLLQQQSSSRMNEMNAFGSDGEGKEHEQHSQLPGSTSNNNNNNNNNMEPPRRGSSASVSMPMMFSSLSDSPNHFHKPRGAPSTSMPFAAPALRTHNYKLTDATAVVEVGETSYNSNNNNNNSFGWSQGRTLRRSRSAPSSSRSPPRPSFMTAKHNNNRGSMWRSIFDAPSTSSASTSNAVELLQAKDAIILDLQSQLLALRGIEQQQRRTHDDDVEVLNVGRCGSTSSSTTFGERSNNNISTSSPPAKKVQWSLPAHDAEEMPSHASHLPWIDAEQHRHAMEELSQDLHQQLTAARLELIRCRSHVEELEAEVAASAEHRERCARLQRDNLQLKQQVWSLQVAQHHQAQPACATTTTIPTATTTTAHTMLASSLPAPSSSLSSRVELDALRHLAGCPMQRSSSSCPDCGEINNNNNNTPSTLENLPRCVRSPSSTRMMDEATEMMLERSPSVRDPNAQPHLHEIKVGHHGQGQHSSPPLATPTTTTSRACAAVDRGGVLSSSEDSNRPRQRSRTMPTTEEEQRRRDAATASSSRRQMLLSAINDALAAAHDLGANVPENTSSSSSSSSSAHDVGNNATNLKTPEHSPAYVAAMRSRQHTQQQQQHQQQRRRSSSPRHVVEDMEELRDTQRLLYDARELLQRTDGSRSPSVHLRANTPPRRSAVEQIRRDDGWATLEEEINLSPCSALSFSDTKKRRRSNSQTQQGLERYVPAHGAAAAAAAAVKESGINVAPLRRHQQRPPSPPPPHHNTNNNNNSSRHAHLFTTSPAPSTSPVASYAQAYLQGRPQKSRSRSHHLDEHNNNNNNNTRSFSAPTGLHTRDNSAEKNLRRSGRRSSSTNAARPAEKLRELRQRYDALLHQLHDTRGHLALMEEKRTTLGAALLQASHLRREDDDYDDERQERLAVLRDRFETTERSLREREAELLAQTQHVHRQLVSVEADTL